MVTELPESVPLLKPKQFCRGSNDGPNGQHCLLGWRYRLFEKCGESLSILSWNALGEEVKARGGECVSVFNDDVRNPKRTLAAVWRAAMRRLGYVVKGDRMVLATKRKVAR